MQSHGRVVHSPSSPLWHPLPCPLTPRVLLLFALPPCFPLSTFLSFLSSLIVESAIGSELSTAHDGVLAPPFAAKSKSHKHAHHSGPPATGTGGGAVDDRKRQRAVEESVSEAERRQREQDSRYIRKAPMQPKNAVMPEPSLNYKDDAPSLEAQLVSRQT